jgi:hypothetical protein
MKVYLLLLAVAALAAVTSAAELGQCDCDDEDTGVRFQSSFHFAKIMAIYSFVCSAWKIVSLLLTHASLIVGQTIPATPIASSDGQVLTRHLKTSQSKMKPPPIRRLPVSLPNLSLPWPQMFREVA